MLKRGVHVAFEFVKEGGMGRIGCGCWREGLLTRFKPTILPSGVEVQLSCI